MKVRCQFEGRFPESKTRCQFKTDITGLDAATMVASLVKSFERVMAENYDKPKRPKLRKIILTVTFP